MTVKELVDKLLLLESDLVVRIALTECDLLTDAYEVRDVLQITKSDNERYNGCYVITKE